MLIVADRWIWDFWLADDGDCYHLFFLSAPRALADEGLRHRHARIDHAVSTDLRDWQVLGTALERGALGDIDETAAWTGSVVRGDDGRWHMFYTGARFLDCYPDQANIETIGVATSWDLVHWTKDAGVRVSADGRWYERLGDSSWPEEAWRDPWVFRAPDGSGWQMLITARGNHGRDDQRGVIGLATSPDLRTWHVQPPVSAVESGFAHAEVPQTVEVGGRWALVFSVPTEGLSAPRRTSKELGGIWSVPGPSATGPFDLEDARLLHDQTRYSGRVVRDREGRMQLLSIVNDEGDGFVGILADPIEVRMADSGHLELAESKTQEEGGGCRSCRIE